MTPESITPDICMDTCESAFASTGHDVRIGKDGSLIICAPKAANPLASIAVKVALTAAIISFTTLTPSIPALGASDGIVKVKQLDAEGNPVDADQMLADSAADGGLPVGSAASPAKPEANDDIHPSIPDTVSPDDADLELSPAADEAHVAASSEAQADGPDASEEGQDEEALALLSLEDEEGEGDFVAMSGETLSVSNAAEMAQAIETMGGVGTINISSSFSVGNPISIPAGANLTVNMNGRTLTGSPVFQMEGGSNLSVNGPGTLQGNSGFIFYGTAQVGSLSVNNGVVLQTSYYILNNTAFLENRTHFGLGCSSNRDEILFEYIQDDDARVLSYANGMFTVRNWTGDDNEVWYAKIMKTYFMTEADYDNYVSNGGVDTELTRYPDTQYNVTFKANDKVVKVDAIYRGHCVGSKMSGDDGVPPTNEQMQALAPSGYRFDGWLDSKGKLYTIDEIRAIPVTGHVTYTAKFTDVNVYYDVSFYYGKDLKTNTKKTFIEGSALEAPTASATNLSGYKLLGWYDTAMDGKQVCSADGGGSTGVAKAMSLYAHYKYLGNYNVSLVVDYPTGAVTKSVSVAADGTVSPSEMPTIDAVAGYDFAGWKVASSGNTSDIGLSKPSVVSSTSDPTLVAITQPTTFTALFKKIAVGPVEPEPIVPPVPDDPTPVVPPNPVVPIPGPAASEEVGDVGASETIAPSSSESPRTPHSPVTPWSPPGLAVAAGFIVPASGPGVTTRDDLELAELSILTAAADGDGDGDDEASNVLLYDAEELDAGSGLPVGVAEAAVVVALTGGVAMTAVIASNVSAFMGANAQAAANGRLRRPGRKKKPSARARRRMALGLE